ncbi:MAG: SEC-C domain-containing protein [Phenylobacterium sp.]|uniref:SEC-C metal-binding domain-containing protein n=1 Tax=Phenylobacterium sp. TaxID=1871053 RepID=UPI0025DC93AC|nr:SEC-C metal-binding domain-containing protein [Phenylobacterium sp.]MCG9915502.1 SEC-C domain-containing protein [Phenylobacterium sp.]
MSDTYKRSPPRDEATVFAALASLCAEPGFAEAIATIRSGEAVIEPKGGLTGASLAHLYGTDRLIRTEVSTLVGLLAQSTIDEATPPPAVTAEQVRRAEALLAEMHDVLSAPFRQTMRDLVDGKGSVPGRDSGEALREPFFYSGEAAFSFQYRDFAVPRYGADDAWLRKHKGFSMAFARDVVMAVEERLVRQIQAVSVARKAGAAGPWLPAFAFSAADIARDLRTTVVRVTPVLEAFALPLDAGNPSFQGVQHFNATNAMPLLRLSGERYVLFQIYSLAEALYESPAFWMAADGEYFDTANRHRGDYPEQFAKNCLAGVFGKAAVHRNVILPGPNRTRRRGEIDTLVVFGEMALVVQTKAKRLTLKARQGDDGQIETDFRGAIQDACDQARDCALALLEGHELRDEHGVSLQLTCPIRRVFPVCLVADHYPALAAQVRQFLTWIPADHVAAPLVTDLFALDTICEMLGSPLRLLNYLHLRDLFGDKLMFNHEVVLLGFHLRQNLWMGEDQDFGLLDDSLAADLEAAMAVRRVGLPGPRTPPGILTRLQDSKLTVIIEQVAREPRAAALGLFLLRLGEDSHRSLSASLGNLATLASRDSKLHDMSFAVGDEGICIHITANIDLGARQRLEAHCEIKKHQQRVNGWYGLLLNPDLRVCGAMGLRRPWAPDPELEEFAKNFTKPPVPRAVLAQMRPPKLRPNAPCPCGSGRKYKKCCRLAET